MATKTKPKRGRPVSTEGFPRINVRLPHDLHKKLTDAANKDYLSINSEVIRRLSYSFGDLKKL